MRRPPSSTPIPYTTLFRSRRSEGELDLLAADGAGGAVGVDEEPAELLGLAEGLEQRRTGLRDAGHPLLGRGGLGAELREGRSEEHTSELQSRENLVCRLLL